MKIKNMVKKNKMRKSRFYKRLSFQVYVYFSIMVVCTCLAVSVIFQTLYQRSYRNSYTERLVALAESISKNIKRIDKKNLDKEYEDYMSYIEDMMKIEGFDVWIVSNPGADTPLQDKYENVVLEDVDLEPETKECLSQAFKGKKSTGYRYDKIYSADIIQTAIPIKREKKAVGAVLMTAVLYRQTMSLNKGRYIISISVIMGLGISMILAVWFARVLSKSTGRVSKKVWRLAAGDYTVTPVKHQASEMGEIEQALNVLGNRLEDAKKERENTEQARMDFFANVSHELRTPITVINGYAESLADGVVTEESRKEALYQRILAECKGMERLVGDLFILSKIQNPDFQIEMEPVSLAQVFEDLIRSVKVISDEKHILIVFSHGTSSCMVLGDYDRLRQMFMVILDNAIKFSDDGGRIDIRILQEEHQFCVEIEDYGCGIPDSDLPFIFEKFYKSKLRQNSKGTGLGLMIAKQIALKHGGDIQVSSVEGEGTKFMFQFDEIQNLEDYE